MRALATGAWVVTGAASGFGREFAVRLARRGASLALFDRDADGLEATRAELAAFRLVVSAPSALRRREELQARELALEEALSVFAKELVFVRKV